MYIVIFDQKAKKDFCKLSREIQGKIADAIRQKLSQNPDIYLIPLAGNLSDFYKFRVGDHRLLCRREDGQLIITVIKVKHRREVYL